MSTQLKNFSANLWCDDQADFWIGSHNSLNSNLPVRSWNWFEEDTSKAITIAASGKCNDFIYVVAYSNQNGRNGLLIDLFDDNNNPVLQNSPSWEVFPTAEDSDPRDPMTSRPTNSEVEQQIVNANNTQGWLNVTFGGPNGSSPFPSSANDIDSNTNYMWFDSGNDSNANAPFNGFNHNEYLIFRHPIESIFEHCEDCDCGGGSDCSGCNENAEEGNKELTERAEGKHNTEPSTNNDSDSPETPFPIPSDCQNQVIPSGTNFEPSFYFHWGDGAKDQVEVHDTEVFYITVCNHFNDILFKGLRITKVNLSPALSMNSAHIVPDRFINIDCLEPCSCQTREFAIITRDTKIAGNYTIEVEYCYDEIVIAAASGQGMASFPLEIIED